MADEGGAPEANHDPGEGCGSQRQELLAEMEAWRLALAKNIALRNPTLSTEELNLAVHRVIARLIFLRVCEERQPGGQGTLRDLLEGKGVAGRLNDLARSGGESCTSGIVRILEGTGRDMPPGRRIPDPVIDDRILKDIIGRLYPPGSSFDIPGIPPFILGQVYGIFLGKVIRLTGGHHARVEEKPEVTRAGGVSCTPRFVVDYVARHTLGELVKGKTPEEVSRLRILDPACGSGSFLIVAYQYLLDWYLGWYLEHLVPVLDEKESVIASGVPSLIPRSPADMKGEKETSGDLPIYRVPKGGTSGVPSEWKLTPAERRRILLNNIFGVDIDPRAVEVTRLLLLTVLGEENGDTLSEGATFPHEEAVLGLHRNIRCGNALVAPDFFRQKQVAPYNIKEQKRIHPFDWNAEFATIMVSGGFDAVIGNPPSTRQESQKEVKEYYQTHYLTYHDTADLSVYFIERGITLLRVGGILSCTIANRWIRTKSGTPFRKWLRERRIEEIVDFGDLPVFRNISTPPCILRVVNAPPAQVFQVSRVTSLESPSLEAYVREHQHPVEMADLNDGGWSLMDSRPGKILVKIREAGTPLDSLIIPRDDKYLFGVLNSRLAHLFFRESRSRVPRDPDPQADVVLKDFPVYVPDFDDPADAERHDRMVALVTQMLDLNKRLHDTTLEHEKTVIERQIEATDREIYDLVYELYGLTEEERGIVEEATGGNRKGA